MDSIVTGRGRLADSDPGIPETLLRVTGPDFCAGAVFALDPPICIRAADKISRVSLNRGLNQVIALCRLKGWRYEIIEPGARGRSRQGASYPG